MINKTLSVTLLGAVALSGCASNSDLPDQAPTSTLERYNRNMHDFNAGLHRHVLHPVGKAVDFVVPDVVEEAIDSIFVNLSVPNTALNNLLQGKPKAAGQDLARFGINSTLGIAGIIDWASMWGLPEHEEDFGQTLATYGVPAGPYVVMPVLGGVTPRDGIGGLASVDMMLLKKDTRQSIDNIQMVVGLAQASEQEELPSYEQQRDFHMAFRHCSAEDGAASAAESCALLCGQFEQMMATELAEIKDPTEREEMLAMSHQMKPAFCRSDSSLISTQPSHRSGE